MNTKRKAVFFDKDGVVNEAVDRGERFVGGEPSSSPTRTRFTAPWTLSEVRLLPGIWEVVHAVHERGYLAIVATNQPDVGYGFMKQSDLDAILAQVRELGFDDMFVCPHGRNDGCLCKKPKPGMLLDAAKKWNIDLAGSFMVGDSASDIGAARAVGVRGVLLNWPYNVDEDADARIATLPELPSLLT